MLEDATQKIQKLLKERFNRSVVHNLTDTRVMGLLACGVIAVLVTWSGVRSVQTNYELQNQISELSQENDVKKLRNSNLSLRNEYLQTDEYIELSARQKFGKALPGEVVYNVPKDVAMANTVENPKTEDVQAKKEAAKPKYQRNLEAWYEFYFGDKNN